MAGSHRTNEELGLSDLDEAFAAFEEKVSKLREEDLFSTQLHKLGWHGDSIAATRAILVAD